MNMSSLFTPNFCKCEHYQKHDMLFFSFPTLSFYCIHQPLFSHPLILYFWLGLEVQ